MGLEWILWAGFGLIIGSFLNVLIARHGVRSILGRSACPRCGTTLQWFELVPVISWLILRGRCRTCSERISIQYPIVELLTAAGFLAIGLAPVPLIERLLGAAIVSILVAIAVYDLYHTIIPDVWAFLFGFLALILAGITRGDMEPWYQVLVSGPAVAFPLFFLWLISRGTWMGLGDAKLALGIGFLLGLIPGYLALAIAFVLGAFVGVFILLPLPRVAETLQRAGITHARAVRGFTMKSEVPFGPFLICALVLVWLSELYRLDLVVHLARFLSWS
ncbi:MAG TPA: prepilin peptidase [Candidatus Paceibacterota bacterium]|nr:prepilin peptidase [Candidatus Paceibacterota bacterium]